jgi:polyhydroxybutyrate depolymerase
MNPTADAAGFIVAYGNGLMSSWNAGACCGDSMTAMVDDVGFLRALVEHLHTQLCIDPARVYSTGMSNGGFMSHRLACEASDLVAAVGPVSASNGMPACDPGRPVPVLMFNGTADPLVAYQGGTFTSAMDTFYDWADRDGCVGQPVVSKQVGLTTCQTFDDCDGGVTVTLCTHEGMGHCWPGQAFCPFGAANLDLVANDELWAFFSQYTLP